MSKAFFHGAAGRPPPFSLAEQRGLLGDVALVRSLCANLPKVRVRVRVRLRLRVSLGLGLRLG